MFWDDVEQAVSVKLAAYKAVIIKGNPKFIEGSPKADKFYKTLGSYVESQGFDVSYDPGSPRTTPDKGADVWIGHSRGADRLEWAPDNVTTIPIGSNRSEAVNHPRDNVNDGPDSPPNSFHYRLTNSMKKDIKSRLSKLAAALPANQATKGLFAKALEKLKGTSFAPKVAPKLKVRGEQGAGSFDSLKHQVVLPQKTNMETALHEVRHSSDPHNSLKRKLLGEANKQFQATGSMESVNPKLIELLSRRIMREEARANVGISRAFDRSGPKFYESFLKDLNVPFKGNWSKIKKRMSHFNSLGGSELASEANPTWLKL